VQRHIKCDNGHTPCQWYIMYPHRHTKCQQYTKYSAKLRHFSSPTHNTKGYSLHRSFPSPVQVLCLCSCVRSKSNQMVLQPERPQYAHLGLAGWGNIRASSHGKTYIPPRTGKHTCLLARENIRASSHGKTYVPPRTEKHTCLLAQENIRASSHNSFSLHFTFLS